MQICPADVFTEEAMTRPLIGELSEAHQRDDPWSGPLGFTIGGEFSPTRRELSQQYFDAAHLLLDGIRKHNLEDYKLANPALFLYRHSLELLIKDVLGVTIATHDLTKLKNQLEVLAKQKTAKPLPRWISARIDEIISIDPSSTFFRYGETNFDRKKNCNVEIDDQIIDAHHLQRAMLALYSAIANEIPEISISYPVKPVPDKDLDY